jgi:flagellin
MSSVTLNQNALAIAAGLGRLQAPRDAASSRVSSGQRLDRPAADVAGLGQAAKLDAQQARLRGIEVNLQNGVSRLQVTSSQIGQMGRLIIRMGELSALATNAVQSPADRALYQAEFTQLQDQLRQTIGGSTAEIGGPTPADNPSGTFNGAVLFGGTTGETLSIGLNDDATLTLPTLNFRTGSLGALITQDPTGAYTTSLTTSGVTATLTQAIEQASTANAEVGAVQSRLDFAAHVATTAKTNHEAALSVIRDADIAADSTTLARLQILTESRNSMLLQARDSRASLIGLLTQN